MFEKNTLNGKSILVTGGSSGLGLSMAKHFAKFGAKVAICGRNQDKLNKAADELNKIGSQVFAYSIDVRDYDGVGKMIEQIIDEFGELNGLVNNAAGNFLSATEDLSPNGFKAIVDIVLHGTFNATHHFGKRLIESKKSGTILNIVTTYAESGCGFVLPSACAKAGVLAMTKSLAFEWATYGIRLNAIAPGPFPTEGAWTRLMPDKETEEKFKKRIAMGRYGEHYELANLAVYLMSDLSPYLTGDCITIDGGERLLAGQFNYLAEIAPRPELRKVLQMMKPKK